MSAAAQPLARARAPKFGVILIVLAVIAALTAIDFSLENAQDDELANQARTAYNSGVHFLQAGKADDAVEAFRKAHALERSNTLYELQLVAALTAAGKTQEAEPLANEVLDADRNDGAANLVVAGLRLKEGKLADAIAYYHRAIYGEWPQDPVAHRIAARMELIDLLVKENRRQDLLAELLPLAEEARANLQIQARLAELFLIAGSPERAAEVARRLIQREPANPDWHAALAEADLALGDYHAARAEFSAASSRRPQDANLKAKAQLASTLASLDPTPRNLTSLEKYQRSEQILGAAQQDLEKCLQTRPNGASEEQNALLERAADAMEAPRPQQISNELAERNLALAQQIWQARVNACGPSAAPDEQPLRLIMAKLAQ